MPLLRGSDIQSVFGYKFMIFNNNNTHECVRRAFHYDLTLALAVAMYI